MSTITNITWKDHQILDTSNHAPSTIESSGISRGDGHGMQVMLPIYTESIVPLALSLLARFQERYKEITIDDLPVILLDGSNAVTAIPFNLNNGTSISDNGGTFYICQQVDIPNEEKISIQLAAIRKFFLQKRQIQYPGESQEYFMRRVQELGLNKMALRVPIGLVSSYRGAFVKSAIDQILTYPDIFKPGETGTFNVFKPKKPNSPISSEAQVILEKGD